MNKEFIAAILCIALMFVGLGMGASALVFLAACATVVVGCYSAYHFKGQKNYWYPIGVIGAFILFVASAAYPGGIICTLLMLMFLGSVLYFAWCAENKEKVNSKPEISRGSYIAIHCPVCGAVIAVRDQFCPSCGSKIGAE